MTDIYYTMFALLRFSLGIDKKFDCKLTAEQWQSLYAEAERQALRGVLYDGVSRLTQPSAAPPLQLAMKWARNRETVRGLNELFNREAARLTQLFESQGHKTAILKGQANARLYPVPDSRQPGDIDIWVDGGRKAIEEMLGKLGMMEGAETKELHHINLPKSMTAVPVEVHNLPSHGNINRRTNQRLQAWLKELLDMGAVMCPEGFRSPSILFAMTMQLAHISQHLLAEGVGMRQVVDYYMLLRAASPDERKQVAGMLKPIGLYHMAEALMWVLAETMHIEEELMLTRPHQRRGQWMLNRIIDGGNLGRFASSQATGLWQVFMQQRRHHWELIKFNPSEGMGLLRFDMDLLLDLLSTIPERIRRRKLRLDGHYIEWFRQWERQHNQNLWET